MEVISSAVEVAQISRIIAGRLFVRSMSLCVPNVSANFFYVDIFVEIAVNHQRFADFARIQNEVLAQNDFSIRVDHRTLQAQQIEAEKHGDEFLAKLYKRVPEEHIGVIAAHRDGAPANEVKKYREIIQSKQHSLFQVDINQKAKAEGKTLFFVSQAEGASRALMNSQAYKSANPDDESLCLLNKEMIAGLTRIRELKRDLVGGLRAKHLAQKEYLSTADYQFIRDYESKLNQRVYLERLLQEFALSTWQYPDNERALRYIEYRIKEKNSNPRTYLAQHNLHYWAIFGKLDNPYQQKNFELVVHNLLQNDLKILAAMKKTSEGVLRNVNAIRERFARQEEPKVTFTLSEVRESLREQYYSLKKKYEDACDSKNLLMIQQVSPMNALERAKNIFVHGDFNKLHAQQKSYEETLEKVTCDKLQYIAWEQNFNRRQWSSNGDRRKRILLSHQEKNPLGTNGTKSCGF